MAFRRRTPATLTLAAASLLLFLWLLLHVIRDQPFAFDGPIRAFLGHLASPALTWIMRAITTCGSEYALAPVGLALIWRWSAAGERRNAQVFAATVLIAELLTQVAKLMTHRPRPDVLFGLPPSDTFSFPSGHSFISTVFYGSLAIMSTPRRKSAGVTALLWGGTVLLVLAIGVSRVYLGYHFPSDVLGGYSAGIVWLLLTQSLAPKSARESQKQDQ